MWHRDALRLAQIGAPLIVGKALQPPFVGATVMVVAAPKKVDQVLAQRRLVAYCGVAGPIFVIIGVIGLAASIFLPHKPSIFVWGKCASYVGYIVVGVGMIKTLFTNTRRSNSQRS